MAQQVTKPLCMQQQVLPRANGVRMKAKTVAGAGHKREELAKRLPLRTPFSLHVFVSHRCNLKCGYCLHSLPPKKIKESGFQKNIMDFSLYCRCLESARRFPERCKVLIFAGWGEPLTHPRIVEMVALAKRHSIADRVEIVSNGTLLTRDLSKRLIDAGLDRIRISIQGLDSAAYRKVAGVDIDFPTLVERIAYFHSRRGKTKMYVKTVSAVVPSSDDQEKFHSIFSGICDEIAVEHIIPVIKDTHTEKFGSDFDKRHCGGDAADVIVCPFPFYMSVVHPDGSYAPCCSSERPIHIGNVGESPLNEIWNGDRLRAFRIAHLEGRRGDCAICRSCPRPRYDLQDGDNLDPYANEILTHYREHSLVRKGSV